ncbi:MULTISPECIES: LytR family transcriptional regulator [Streptomyces]|uniref:LytR family transcriptional regulator n=1 Tax=Streptomyces TaxID=1883 RepID=UPI00101E7B9D|nr:LytR family transcriptional regulator [Streptomyces albidoflavus]NVI31042.1 LytR family transcriptional regulator [Streptomyces sp. CAI-17]RZD86152.1 LytR family transcriptional regulator [Streptomyces albidoflavus]RZD89055.1 LytR family transcriptional regulator [Streptomyces albidoflavus]RZE04714.1 LytR family transcriptional regulator [Streptomyces albidoflavus]
MPDLARPAGERSAPAAQHPRHLGGEGVEEAFGERRAGLRAGAGGPLGLKGVLDAVTGSVSVDEAMSDAELRRLLWRGTRELRPADITYRAAPLKGTGTVAGQSVVHLDLPRLAVPARALREDRAGLPR